MRFTILVVTFTALLLAACGDDNGDGGRAITVNDLPQIVLQPEDVQIGELQEPIIQGDQNSSAYGHQFEVPPGEGTSGDIVCITASLGLYAGNSQAEAAFDSVGSSIDQVISAGRGQRLFVPVLGDESDGFATSGSADFCTHYLGTTFEGITVYFRDGALLVSIGIYVLETGATIEDAVHYAELQLDKIEQFRASA